MGVLMRGGMRCLMWGKAPRRQFGLLAPILQSHLGFVRLRKPWVAMQRVLPTPCSLALGPQSRSGDRLLFLIAFEIFNDQTDGELGLDDEHLVVTGFVKHGIHKNEPG